MFPQDHVAVAHDAVKVIIEALNQNPCLSLNGTYSITSERDEMFNCMKKVIHVNVCIIFGVLSTTKSE